MKKINNNINMIYYISMILLISNMIFIIVGGRHGINMFLPYIIEIILYIIFIQTWINNTKKNVNTKICRYMYIANVIFIISMISNAIIYKVYDSLTVSHNLQRTIIDFIVFIIILKYSGQYNNDLMNSKALINDVKLCKYTATIIIMVWCISKIIR